MKCEVLRENPIYYYGGCCPEFGQKIALYSKDLHNAEIGDSWSCEDQNCYPNRTNEWTVTVTVVYKNEDGLALVTTFSNGENSEIVWVDLHK